MGTGVGRGVAGRVGVLNPCLEKTGYYCPLLRKELPQSMDASQTAISCLRAAAGRAFRDTCLRCLGRWQSGSAGAGLPEGQAGQAPSKMVHPHGREGGFSPSRYAGLVLGR